MKLFLLFLPILVALAALLIHSPKAREFAVDLGYRASQVLFGHMSRSGLVLHASVPTGTIYSVATVFAASKPVTSISNASEAVVSCTAHGYAVGDIVQLYVGWGRLNRRAARVKSVTTDTFVAEGIDTTNTDFFPPGSGGGTVRKVSTFQQINKILNPTNSGGDPKNVTVKFLESDVEQTINDGFTAVTESFDIDADEFGQASYAALRSLSEVQTDTILKKTLRSGSMIFTPCRVSLNENVKMTDGQVITNAVSINGNGRLTRYSAS